MDSEKRMDKDTMITFMDAMLLGMEGKDPSKAIENQERRGQQSVVRNQRLPKKSNDLTLPDDVRFKDVQRDMEYKERHKIVTRNNIEYTKQQYEKMGIIIIEEHDDLFWNVQLPEGWEIKATDHTMWNNLYDDKGRKRANFFYKAAFYDRDAFINFDTRFNLSVEYIADIDSDFETWEKSDYQGTVKDGEEVIFSTDCIPPVDNYDENREKQNILRAQLEEYMHKNYPDYEDINAYWD